MTVRAALLLCVTVIAALCAAAALLLGQGRGATADDPAPSLPDLDVRCTAAAHYPSRVRRARYAEAAATAAIERYPFDTGAGLLALRRLLEAARCLALAGEREAGTQLELRAAAWRARLYADCRDRYLRYRVARVSERLEHALADVEFLRVLCAPEGGPLAERLRREQLDITERHHSEETP